MKLQKKLLLSSLLAATLLHATPDCQQTYKVQSFVKRFYSNVLGRAADNGGLDYWTNKLTSKESTGADVATGFVFSAEYDAAHKENETYVRTMYKSFFNREADAGGLAYWLEELGKGKTKEEVLDGFLKSQEFINLANDYGIQAYAGAAFQSTQIDDFVKRFYSVILGRDADDAGLRDWAGKLSTGALTGADIAKGFIFSAEYNLDSKSEAQYLNDLYSAFFNREADQAGFDGWISQLNSGTYRGTNRCRYSQRFYLLCRI